VDYTGQLLLFFLEQLQFGYTVEDNKNCLNKIPSTELAAAIWGRKMLKYKFFIFLEPSFW